MEEVIQKMILSPNGSISFGGGHTTETRKSHRFHENHGYRITSEEGEAFLIGEREVSEAEALEMFLNWAKPIQARHIESASQYWGAYKSLGFFGMKNAGLPCECSSSTEKGNNWIRLRPVTSLYVTVYIEGEEGEPSPQEVKVWVG